MKSEEAREFLREEYLRVENRPGAELYADKLWGLLNPEASHDAVGKIPPQPEFRGNIKDNGPSLSGGPVCDKHLGPTEVAVDSGAGLWICPVCTPLGRTHEETRAIARRQRKLWSQL